jgi:hypothetical protein
LKNGKKKKKNALNAFKSAFLQLNRPPTAVRPPFIKNKYRVEIKKYALPPKRFSRRGYCHTII